MEFVDVECHVIFLIAKTTEVVDNYISLHSYFVIGNHKIPLDIEIR